MTRQRDLKTRIRQRMQKTGERYTAARAHVLSKSPASVNTASFPGVLSGYDRFGGVQGETAILKNVLRHAGIAHPHTRQPYSEAMLHGLCGGLGFMYAVFEYKGWPPMLTIVMRSGTMPHTYLMPIFERIGLRINSHQTSGAKSAQKQLDAALDSGQPAICVTDIAALPYYGVPKEMMGMGPHYVAVVGRDGDDYWLDDRAPRPCRVSRNQLAAARGGYKQAKHHLITIEGTEGTIDWRDALNDALGVTRRAMLDGDVGVPKSFRSNTGITGMEKWCRLLTDKKDKKGWRSVFATPGNAYVGLRRAYECIQYEYTAPAGGRALYADFLIEAAELTNDDAFRVAANEWHAAAEAWQSFAICIANAPDDALQKGCQLCDRRAELLDHEGEAASTTLQSLAHEQRGLKDACTLSMDDAFALFDSLAEQLESIIQIERRAIDALPSIR